MKTCKLLKVSLFLGLLCLLISCSEKEENDEGGMEPQKNETTYFLGVWMTKTGWSYYSFYLDGTCDYEYCVADNTSEDGFRAHCATTSYHYNEAQETLVIGSTLYLIQTKENDNIVLVNSSDMTVLDLTRKLSEPLPLSYTDSDWLVKFKLEESEYASDDYNYDLVFEIKYPARLQAKLISTSGIAVKCLNGEIADGSLNHVHKTSGVNNEWKWYIKRSNGYEDYWGTPCEFSIASSDSKLEIEYFIWYYRNGRITSTDPRKLTLRIGESTTIAWE